MGGYIGARSGVGLVTTTVGNVQDLTATDTTPEVTIVNSTHEDTDGGREGKVIFKGQQSGGEETTLAEIQGSHDGTSDDEKGDLIFRTNDGNDGASPTERMRIDSAGKVDVTGTVTADAYALDSIAIPSAGTATIFNRNTDNNLYIQTGSGNTVNVLDGSQNTLYAVSPTSHIFQISNAEKMRIDSSGNLAVAKTAVDTDTVGIELRSNGLLASTRNGGQCLFLNRLSSDGTIASFAQTGSTKGSITISGSSTAYNTSSDYRLKENVTDVTDGITRVKQLAPKRFNFIADADTTVDGFLAHEAQAVVPEAVHGTKDEVDDDDNPVMQGIDQSKLVPLLTAALQEAIAKIETLETKVAALEAE